MYVEQIKTIKNEIEDIENEINKRFNSNMLLTKLRSRLTNLENNILNKNSRKKIIIDFIELNNEVTNTERNMEFPKYEEWSWFIYLSELRKAINHLYSLIFNDDDKEYPIIEFIESIIEDWMEFYDISLVPENIKNKYKTIIKKWDMIIHNDWKVEIEDTNTVEESYILSTWLLKEYPGGYVRFKNIDEILCFIEWKGWYKF